MSPLKEVRRSTEMRCERQWAEVVSMGQDGILFLSIQPHLKLCHRVILPSPFMLPGRPIVSHHTGTEFTAECDPKLSLRIGRNSLREMQSCTFQVLIHGASLIRLFFSQRVRI